MASGYDPVVVSDLGCSKILFSTGDTVPLETGDSVVGLPGKVASTCEQDKKCDIKVSKC